MVNARRVVLAILFVLVAASCATETATPPEPDPPPQPDPAPQIPSDELPDESPEDDHVPVAPDLGVNVVLTEVGRVGSAIAGAAHPDGTFYVADRAGTVHILDEDGVGPPVLDISGETTTDGERGLLGLAFAPDGTAFVSYTDTGGASRVDAVDLSSGERRNVFTVEQPYANHNGGDIAFGPDEMLYIGLGDGGGAGDPLDAGQDLSTVLGAMVRIDPFGAEPYAVPADNPFVDDADARDEIAFYGLRNPWRFSFDRETGQLWIADVGQQTREEINRLDPIADRGANLGWAAMEGTVVFNGPEPDDHHAPVFEYDTTSQRCAITGGYVYRGGAIAELTGAYLFSDYCEGAIRGIYVDDEGVVRDEADLGVAGGRVVACADDAAGALMILALAGAIYRLDPA